MREIVTIQVGDFANYIGSHFWNFQDELLGLAEDPHGDPIFKSPYLDMGVLYRTGETQQGIPTYTPRLISVSLQGSLGSLSSSGSLYNDITSSEKANILTWAGSVSRHASEPHKKNLFLQSLYEEEQEGFPAMADNAKECGSSHKKVQDRDLVECLENSIQFWTDYSKVHYHPQSLYQLYGSWADVNTFDDFGVGKDVLSEGLQREEMNDKLRFFVEECDHIQGIQFIVDDSGGFSSIAADFLENISDEYTNTPVLLYTARDPGSFTNDMSKKSISRALHDAVSAARLSSFCKLMVPVGLPSITRSKLSSSLHVEDQKTFHCSAIYAASLHALSIPFRMDLLGPTANSADISGAVDIDELAQILAGQAGQSKMAIMDVSMPAPSLTVGQSQRSIISSLKSLTPEIMENDDDMHVVESLVIHGALHSGDHRASVSQVKDSVVAAYQSGLPRPVFSHLSVSTCPLPIPLPFPSIFRNHVGRHGELVGTPAEGAPLKGPLEIDSIPVAARLRSSKAIMPFIERRLGGLRKYGIERGAPGAELLRSWGFGRDDLEEMVEDLVGMAKALDPYSQSTSDSDPD